MERIKALMSDIRVLTGTQLTVKYRNGEAQISFPNGRSQTVYVARQGDRYLFTSRVMGSTRVRELSLWDLARCIWVRNRGTDVVELALDESGRLIGRIEQVAETLDRAELKYYLTELAQKCDRLEYVLTGRDLM